jgi:hypothetical protein
VGEDVGLERRLPLLLALPAPALVAAAARGLRQDRGAEVLAGPLIRVCRAWSRGGEAAIGLFFRCVVGLRVGLLRPRQR